MTIWLRQSTAVTVKLGPFVDQADGYTAETSLTISQADVRLSKNGGNMAQKNDTTSLTHDEIGHYDCPLNATDTNTLGVLRVMVHESGALPVWQDFMVVPANVWDSMFGADVLNVNVAEVSDDATAANNMELMFDGTGYAGGTTRLGVDLRAIVGNAARATTLLNVLNESPMLSVNVSQFGGSMTGVDNALTAYMGIVRGRAITGTLTNTAFTTNLTETTDDHYNGRTLTFIGGALAGQMTTITDYNGTTKVVTVAAMTEAPGNYDEFFIA